jgi:integrase
MASIDQRGAGWRARVRIPGHKDKNRTFDTQAEAEVWARRTEAQLRNGIDTIPDLASEPTLNEALTRYGEEVTPEKKGREQESRRINAWRERPVAKLKLSQLTATHFVEFRKQRVADGRAGNTIRLDLSLISNLYKVAKIDWGMPYLQNPIALLRKPKAGKGRDRRLTSDEMARFTRALDQCRNQLVPAVAKFALHTAARQGEILRLRRDQVDVKRRVMILRDTKNGDDRVVPLSKEALDILMERLRAPADVPRVFPVTRDSIASAWGRMLKRAAIEDFRFHDLRHEATSRLFERGLSIMEVQRITGHKTLAMLIRYTHMDVGRLVERLDATDTHQPREPRPTEPVRSTDREAQDVRAAWIGGSREPAPSSDCRTATLALIAPELGRKSGGAPSTNVIPFVPRR